VTDDGVGLPPELDLQHSQTFGLRLLKLMVEEQLHGQLAVESNHGTRVRCAIGVKIESKNICG
jgi:two-component sensor histidine kinase